MEFLEVDSILNLLNTVHISNMFLLFIIVNHFKKCHPRCADKLDRWAGSQKHNSYDIQKMYILKS